MELYEQASGARMHAAYYRVGGFSAHVRPEFLSNLYVVLKGFSYRLDELHNLLTSNPIWYARLQGVGVVTKRDALTMAFSGPLLRGSGIP